MTRQNQARARVNHVAVEDAQVAPDVIIGMILVNDNGTQFSYLILEHLIHL
jgi:hypothetical protein